MPTGFLNSRGQAENQNRGTTLHFDRGIMAAFVGVILTLLVQTGSLIWWASHVSTTMAEQERRIISVETWRDNMTHQNELLIRMEAEHAHQTDTLSKILKDHEDLEHRVMQLELTRRLPAGK